MEEKIIISILIPPVIILCIMMYWFRSDFLEFKLKVGKRLDEMEMKK